MLGKKLSPSNLHNILLYLKTNGENIASLEQNISDFLEALRLQLVIEASNSVKLGRQVQFNVGFKDYGGIEWGIIVDYLVGADAGYVILHNLGEAKRFDRSVFEWTNQILHMPATDQLLQGWASEHKAADQLTDWQTYSLSGLDNPLIKWVLDKQSIFHQFVDEHAEHYVETGEMIGDHAVATLINLFNQDTGGITNAPALIGMWHLLRISTESVQRKNENE